MSWPLASSAIVAAVLGCGWLAHERARPSARMVALVATLAAIAALGRDAFVALPDVKPITAIALVVGYALGPLPGFTVGAVGMLASNIMLGQGPYTPWQMVAWGLVGLVGALFARLTGRHAGRLALALACAASALMAKEIMNLYVWTLGGVYTPAALLARVVEGLPFDVTDTVASFLFGLAFGPELARVLGRVRVRMDVDWGPAPAPAPAPVSAAGGSRASTPSRDVRPSAGSIGATLLLALALGGMLAGATGIARAADARAASFSAEIAYLQRAQDSDGGFGPSPGARSSELYTAWVALGMAAAGRDPQDVARDGHSVLAALRAEASTLDGAGDYERTILALHACGVPASSFPGESLVARLLRERSRDGSFDDLVNITTFAIFALRVAGTSADNEVVNAAGRWLAAQQDGDGGFGFGPRGGGEDVDDTAAALQAAIDASGQRHSPLVARAVAYLRRAQNPDGGFPQQPGGESNAQSTAWAIQGLDAAGVDVTALRRDGGRSPIGYLQSLVTGEGSVRYSRTSAQSPVWVTAEALAALAGKPFPIAPV